MCNIYVILKTTGEYEDTFTTAECACLSNSEALEVKKRLDEKYQNCAISQEEWWNYREKLYDYEEQHDIEFESYSEGFAKLFSELNKKDIELAEEIYEGLDGIPYFHVKEVPLLGDNIPENLIQILNGSNN